MEGAIRSWADGVRKGGRNQQGLLEGKNQRVAQEADRIRTKLQQYREDLVSTLSENVRTENEEFTLPNSKDRSSRGNGEAVE